MPSSGETRISARYGSKKNLESLLPCLWVSTELRWEFVEAFVWVNLLEWQWRIWKFLGDAAGSSGRLFWKARAGGGKTLEGQL